MLAKPYISKDDNPFYIIDNPIVRDKVFRMPMVRPTSGRATCTRRSGSWVTIKRTMSQCKGCSATFAVKKLGKRDACTSTPTFFTETGLEIINPHDRKRRVGKNPILFESVPAGQGYVFLTLCSLRPDRAARRGNPQTSHRRFASACPRLASYVPHLRLFCQAHQWLWSGGRQDIWPA